MRARPRPKRYVRKLAARRAMGPAPKGQAVGPDLRPHQVILRPLITEKGTHQSTRYNAYTFEVARHATKDMIKAAVQELFNVRVDSVRTQVHSGKKRRYRFRVGQLPNWKKAIVTLHDEDRIEFF